MIISRKILVLSLLVIFTACERGEEIASYILSQEDRAFIPYQEGDSIPFIHSNGFEFSLIANTRVIYREISERHHPRDDYYSYEVETVYLSSYEPDLSIVIKIYPQEYLNVFGIEINRYSFGRYLNGIPDFDSLSLNGRIYRNIYQLTGGNADPGIIIPDSIYYSSGEGIIKISMTSDEAYYLNP